MHIVPDPTQKESEAALAIQARFDERCRAAGIPGRLVIEVGDVTRKITEAAARIKLGLADELHLGNIDAKRDWGYAPEYVDAMWRMLRADEPDDYVIGTGIHHSVRQCVEFAFGHVDLDPDDFVRVDPSLIRPAEVDTLLADPTKAREALGWTAKTTFEELVHIMVEADLEAQERLSGRRRDRGRSR